MMLVTTRKIGSSLCALCALALLLILSACVESRSTVDVNQNGEASISVKAPSFLNTRAIDFATLRPTLTINNDLVEITRQNDIWVGSTTVPVNSAVVVLVEWYEELDNGERLLLASAFNNQVQNITGTRIFQVGDDSYVTSGARFGPFDPDGDGIDNLKEREEDIDPLVANVDPNGLVPADVQIFAHNESTEINGRIDQTTFWSNAVYEDVDRELLYINNMIRDDSEGIAGDPEPDYQWAAIHNEEYLTIFVFGKRRNGSTIRINGDSGDEYHKDDSLEIYWDGNLSASPFEYDGVDDMLINIPLTMGVAPYDENNSGDIRKRVFRGNNVKDEFIFDVEDENNVEFATCFCDGERVTWEVRINLATAKIPVGKTFGFEIQINRDDDGGDRDSKWAWEKAGLQPGDAPDAADVTWRYPSYMGKALLVPFPRQ